MTIYKDRNYQKELYEEAIKTNVIIKLDTGAGKTYIAAMVIRYIMFKNSDKKIFFLVKNASLGSQQEAYLKKYLFLEEEIGFYHGNMGGSNIDYWTEDMWKRVISSRKILIMTAKIFLDIINHNKYKVANISLLVFDEVHHLNKNDDYAQIAERIKGLGCRFKILGLTACLMKNCKIDEVEYLMDELEFKLMSKIVTTKKSIDEEYQHDVDEQFIQFKNISFEEFSDCFSTTIELFKSMNKVNDSADNRFTRIKSTDTNYLSKTVNSIKRVLETFGAFICHLVVKIYFEELKIENTVFDEDSIRALEIFKAFLIALSSKLTCINEKSPFYITEKVTKLLIFLMENCNSPSTDECVLIFIDERIQVLALAEFLNYIANTKKEYEQFKCNFVTGQNTSAFPTKLSMTIKNVEKVLNAFKSHKFKVLVATNVIEEGQDVPCCNVVIKFDPPKEFRSYIQSRGRARAEQAKYAVFSDNVSMVKGNVRNYHFINTTINRYLEKKVINVDDDIDTDICLPLEKDSIDSNDIYKYKGAYIDVRSASGVLCRYVSRLRFNSISDVKVQYNFEEIENLTRVTVLFPMPCPCTTPVIYEGTASKQLSKKRANLLACKILHQKYGELDDSLLPYKKFNETEEYQKSMKEANTVKYFPRPISDIWLPVETKSNPPTPRLYRVIFKPDFTQLLDFEDISMFKKDLSFGLITLNKPLLSNERKKIQFPLYLAKGEVQVVVEEVENFSGFTESFHLKNILEFHKKVTQLYTERLNKFEKNIKYDESIISNVQFVLISDDCVAEISYSKMSEFCDRQLTDKLINQPLNTWSGSIIRPLYRSTEFGAFVVTGLSRDKTLDTIHTFNMVNMTYREYFLSKYQHTAPLLSDADGKLPMIHCVCLTTFENCVSPISMDASKSDCLKNSSDTNQMEDRDNSYGNSHFQSQLLSPNLVEVIGLQCNLWSQLCILPSIIYRINQINVVTSLAHHLEQAKIFNYKPIPINALQNCNLSKFPFVLDFTKCYIISDISEYTVPESLDEVIHRFLAVITTKSCNQSYDLERLEILGDSFLKMITSKYIFHFHPNNNEGKLSYRRVQLISNLNLYQLALKIHLEQYLFVDNFDPKLHAFLPNWINELDDKELNERFYAQYKTKQLADCLEALIGMVLINWGWQSAILLLIWMGMDLPGKPDLNQPTNCQEMSRYLNLIARNPDLDESDVFSEVSFKDYLGTESWTSELEDILQYKFTHKYHLIQAVTHPTSIQNRKFQCYQRLEFLGDAILDFLLTSQIMYNNPELQPGDVTTLRSALVNNNIFAYLSVKYKFYKYLNFFDDKMFAIFPEVINKIEKYDFKGNMRFLKDMEYYKVMVKNLGDIFESIVGAVYVDSNYNLFEVSRVFRPFLKEPLEKYSNNIPKNKISLMFEIFHPICSYNTEDNTDLIMMVAHVKDKKYEVKERNKRLCRLALAEILLPD